ncbi:MAG: PIN domain-containing protein [Methylophilaceae bacterium]|nr:PIN domain-containing protein [Methyloradius sp.]
MAEKLLLVDFENVHQVDLSRLDESFNVTIFVGASQKSIPIDLVTNAQKLGSRIEWQRIEGNGSNALDFYIAMQLGRILEKTPKLECIVLSKDKGFDPLLRYLNKSGLKCKRLNSLMELDSKPVVSTDPNYQRVVELLSRTDKKNLPRRRKTLTQHVSAMFQKKLPSTDVDKIIDILFANKLVSETNNIISYEL